MMEEAQKIHDAQISDTTSDSLLIQDLRYSGFWVRGAAYIIDNFIAGIIAGVLLVPFRIIASLMFFFLDSVFSGVFFWIIMGSIGLCVRWGYFVFMTYKFQATLGKMVVGVKVLSDDGRILPLQQIIIRETIGKILSCIALGIGFLAIAFTGKKQGFHDMIAHSAVVCKDPQAGPNKSVVGIIYGIQVLIVGSFLLFFGMIIALFGWIAMSMPDAVPEEVIELDEQFFHELQLDIPENMPIKSL